MGMGNATPMGGFRAIRITATTMDEPAGQAALLRLLTWLSPAFPVGAFAYSHGLERAILDGLVRDRESLAGWLMDLVERGSGWNDAVLLAAAWRTAAAGDSCDGVAELAEAMTGSRQRHMETTLQGEAFGNAMQFWRRALASPDRAKTDADAAPYPVIVGRSAADQGVGLEETIVAYLYAFASNLVQAAIRLVPLGQRDGVATVALLEAVLLATAVRAAGSTLDDLGSATFMSEIVAMKHETQYSRVFRS